LSNHRCRLHAYRKYCFMKIKRKKQEKNKEKFEVKKRKRKPMMKSGEVEEWGTRRK
jgi:hypothetical protein